jgi:hypothetical protein
MTKMIAVFVLAASLAGCSSSPFSQAPAAQVTPTASPNAYPNIPRSQVECVTDEGYGRYVPCGNKS